MKNLTQYSSGMLSLVCVALVLQGCPAHKDVEFYALTGAVSGHFEWVQSITPTRTLTPQSVGFTRQLAVGTDKDGAYVAFYRNDTLQRRQNETRTDTSHTFVDEVRQTVLIKYGAAGFLKYTIVPGSNMITVSDFLPNSYSSDTVKNVYKKANPTLYPY